MAQTNTFGWELPQALPAPRLRSQLLEVAQARALPITIRADEPFEPQARWATAPERLVEEDGEGATYWLHLPPGGRHNTEIVWDPLRDRLSVGVWSRRLTQREREHPRRLRSPRRLLWHGAIWRPDADGAHATASLHGSWLRLRLPFAKARSN